MIKNYGDLELAYDVIVVGAGPGGSACAKIAAEEGLKVLVLERGRYPGEKNTSGSTIWGNVAREIIPDFPADAPIERVVDGSRMYWVPDPGPDWSEFSGASKDKTYVDPLDVYRNEFDKWWAEQAVQAGAELRNSTKVVNVIRDGTKITGVLTEKGEKIEGQITVGADGVNSIIARMSGLRPKWPATENALCIKYDWVMDEKTITDRWGSGMDDGVLIEVYWGATIGGNAGYFWIFPNRNSVSLGLGSLMSDYIKYGYNTHWYMDNSINHPLVKPKLKGGKLREIHAHAIPLTDPLMGYMNYTYGDGVLIVGDAAGMVCAIDGAGWYGAVKAGKLAAKTSVRAIETGDTSADTLARYQKKWSEGDIGKTLKIGKEMEIWLTHDVGINNLAQMVTASNAHSMEHPLDLSSFISGNVANISKLLSGVRFGRRALMPYLELFGSLLGGK
ncbi:MAG: NAD(P)/FAD-dependent oxidoreductase [Candidatus Helarchaeota archaeon]|nr:NAD(P)/FAD-dependent oxidoreductase [Candidatus Helarchaeota archaeon]